MVLDVSRFGGKIEGTVGNAPGFAWVYRGFASDPEDTGAAVHSYVDEMQYRVIWFPGAG